MTLIELAEKVMARAVADANGCLIWPGARSTSGYGQVWTGERTILTHRVMYEFTHGPVPDGLQVDHLCRVRACCNPDHLEAVTPRENTRRGNAGIATRIAADAQTHCRHGHPRSEQNVYLSKAGKRHCRQCMKERQNRRYRAFRAAGKTINGKDRQRGIWKRHREAEAAK